jgi:hypothetical protein
MLALKNGSRSSHRREGVGALVLAQKPPFSGLKKSLMLKFCGVCYDAPVVY